jgi:hypothetical protein
VTSLFFFKSSRRLLKSNLRLTSTLFEYRFEHQHHQQPPEVSVGTSATMADPPKGLSRPDFRKGKKLQVECPLVTMDLKMPCVLTRVLKITWEISAHASLRSATRMQQEPQKITANNPLMSGFPALPSTAVVRRTTAAQVRCPSPTSKCLFC